MSAQEEGPLIGVTCGEPAGERPGEWGLAAAYARALAAAGGVPVLVVPAAGGAVLTRLDGLLLPGGPDVDPACFGAQPHPALGRVDPERDTLELALARGALARRVPVLGICRGVQLLAVAAGGSVRQDIAAELPSALQHSQRSPRWHASHGVDLVPASRLSSLYATTSLRVNSFHHQAVHTVATDWEIVARAPDGVVEGIEARHHPFALGVQWHPEGMWHCRPEHLRPFTALVEAARSRRESGKG